MGTTGISATAPSPVKVLSKTFNHSLRIDSPERMRGQLPGSLPWSLITAEAPSIPSMEASETWKFAGQFNIPLNDKQEEVLSTVFDIM
jgi:hypothetical protein